MTVHTLSSDFVTVDSLVLVIDTMREFNENGNYVDQDHEKEKTKEPEKFYEQTEKDLNGKLDGTVCLSGYYMNDKCLITIE